MNINRKRQFLVVALATVCMAQAIPTMALDEIRVRVNGAQVSFPDGKPFIDENSRVLVPIRFVSQQLGAQVNWDSKTKKVTIVDGDKNATLTINSKQVKVNGENKTLDTAAVVKNERTYVPLRFVGEAFGAGVRWDNKVRIVYIDNGKPALPQTEVIEMGCFTIPTHRMDYVVQTSSGWGGDTEKGVHYNISDVGTPKQDNSIIITHKHNVTLAEMYDETEEYLRQVISPSKAKEIMDFCRKKTDPMYFIGEKTIKENDIYVQAFNIFEGVIVKVTKDKDGLVTKESIEPAWSEKVIE